MSQQLKSPLNVSSAAFAILTSLLSSLSSAQDLVIDSQLTLGVDADPNGQAWDYTDQTIHLGTLANNPANLTVPAGQSLQFAILDLGVGDANSSGTLTIDGIGASLASAVDNLSTGDSLLRVGVDGHGELLATNGASVTLRLTDLGINSGAHGVLSVAGPQTQLNSIGWGLNIGVAGTAEATFTDNSISTGFGFVYTGTASGGNGQLNVMAGASLSSGGSVRSGFAADSLGHILVDGANSSLQGSFFHIGSDGDGTMLVSNGASATTPGSTSIGSSNGSNGQLTVTGVDSSFEADNFLYVGRSGQGSLTVSDGAEVLTASSLRLGREVGGEGQALVTGAGSLLQSDDFLHVGGDGHGELSIAAGGVVDIAASISVSRTSGASGTISITGNGSLLRSGSFFRVGRFDSGTLTVEDGGSVEVMNGDFTVGSGGNGQGLASFVGANTKLTVTEEMRIAFNGSASFDLLDGAVASAGSHVVIAANSANTGASADVNIAGLNTSFSVGSDLLLASSIDTSGEISPSGGLARLTVSDQATVNVNDLLALRGNSKLTIDHATVQVNGQLNSADGTLELVIDPNHSATLSANSIELNSTQLLLNLAYQPLPGEIITLIDNSGGSPVNGNFSLFGKTLTQGSLFTVESNGFIAHFRIDYQHESDQSVAIHCVERNNQLEDDFDLFLDGPLQNQGEWVRGPSVDNPSNHLVVEDGAVKFDWTTAQPINNLLRRNLPYGNIVRGDIFAKFSLRMSTAPANFANSPSFFSFGDSPGEIQRGHVGVRPGSVSNTFQLGVSAKFGFASDFNFHPQNLQLNTDYQIMVRYNNDTSTIDLWLDQPDPNQAPTLSDSANESTRDLRRINLRMNNNGSSNLGVFFLDNLAVPQLPFLALSLPNPLINLDGSPVTSSNQWINQRRPEILEIFREQMHGRVPANFPASQSFSLETPPRSELEGTAQFSEHRVEYQGPGGTNSFLVTLLTPDSPTPPKGLFIFMNINSSSIISNALSPNGESERWPVRALINRGYATAAFQHTSISPSQVADFASTDHVFGIADPTGQRDPDSWGIIAAWAWGMSRTVDLLTSLPELSGVPLGVVSHSRGGKAALWAGANDSRLSLIVSNNSGTGGAALSNMPAAARETVRRLNDQFPGWFNDNFKQFNDNEANMPFDQHWLLGLTAPRHVYVASASEDFNAAPSAEFRAAVEAEPIFQLLNLDGVGSNSFPMPNTRRHAGHIAYHLRDGEHSINRFDWSNYLDYADQIWQNHSYSLQAWRFIHGLGAEATQDFADPADDGVPNLMKYALNLAPQVDQLSQPAFTMPFNGQAGLPATRQLSDHSFEFQFVRRRSQSSPGIRYQVETSHNLSTWQITDLTPSTEILDSTWERVTYRLDPTAPSPSSAQFIRLRILPD